MIEIPLMKLALFLLTLRIISDVFIGIVLYRQWKLLKVQLPDSVRRFRRRLLAITSVLFVANLYPIVLDILALTGENVGRSAGVKLPGAIYALDNAGFAAVTGFLVWSLYKLSANTKEDNDFIQVGLQGQIDAGLSRENSKANRK